MDKQLKADGPRDGLGLQQVYVPSFFSDLEYDATTMEFDDLAALLEADDQKVIYEV